MYPTYHGIIGMFSSWGTVFSEYVSIAEAKFQGK